MIKILAPSIRIAAKNNKPFLVFLFSLLLLWMKIQAIMKIVGINNEAPPNPKIKFELSLSKLIETKNTIAVKRGIAHIINLWSDFTKGNERKKIPIGIIKNWLPPHAEIDNGTTIPAAINFTVAIFLFLELRPLSKK